MFRAILALQSHPNCFNCQSIFESFETRKFHASTPTIFQSPRENEGKNSAARDARALRAISYASNGSSALEPGEEIKNAGSRAEEETRRARRVINERDKDRR